MGDELNKKVVLLPTKCINFVDVDELIEKVKNHIHKYCDVTSDFELLASYYVLLTYVYDCFNELPYLSFQGDTGTGKSRAKNTIGMICYKPMLNNGGASSAAMYRITEKWKGTMVMDEADIKDSDEQNDVIKYLNCGFEKNSPIMKCDKNNPNKIDFFDPYCPKIIARRQSWKDKATESRCITEITKTTHRKDIAFNLNSIFYDDCLFIRNKLTSFRINYWQKYNEYDFSENELDIDVEPRLKQTLNSIICLLKPFPDSLNVLKRFLLDKQQEVINERATSFDGEIINVIYELLEVQKREYIISKDIADVINSGENNLKFKVTPRSISAKLKSLGIRTAGVQRIGDKTCRKIITYSGIMAELYKKYGCYTVTNVTRYYDTPKYNNIIKKDGFCFGDTVPPDGVTTVTSVTEKGKEIDDIRFRKNVPLYGVTTVTPVTEKSKDYGKMAEFLAKHQSYCNDVKLFELFDEKLIRLSLEHGLIFENPKGYFHLT